MDDENPEKILQNAILAVLDIKPPDPLRFLAHYFQMECEKSNFVGQAAYLLQDMTIHHPALDERILKAYTTMSQYRVQQDVRGLTGDIYTDLLVNLTPELQASQRDKLIQKLQCQSTECVPFSIFQSGVQTCILLNEFVKSVKGLFSEVSNENGEVSKIACDILVKEIRKCLSATEGDTSKILEIGTSLAVPKLSSTLKEVASSPVGSVKECKKLDVFLAETTDLFLQQVKQIK